MEKLEKEELLTKLESDIVKCTTYDDVFEQIAAYFMSLACDGFSIVIDKRLYEGVAESELVTDGYDEDNLVVAYATEGRKVLKIKEPDALRKYFDETGARNAYMFTPIHFREKAVGYSILKNGRFLYDLSLIHISEPTRP